jgi:TnpA family transposase
VFLTLLEKRTFFLHLNNKISMPRKQTLSESDKKELIRLPELEEEFIRCYSLSERDISIIQNNCRGNANKIGYAVNLCYMRYPGIILPLNQIPDPTLVNYIGEQLNIKPENWNEYGKRVETRREHLLSIQLNFKINSFSMENYKKCVNQLRDIALKTDKGLVLARELMNILREQRILLPSINVIERICAEVNFLQKSGQISLAPMLRF